MSLLTFITFVSKGNGQIQTSVNKSTTTTKPATTTPKAEDQEQMLSSNFCKNKMSVQPRVVSRAELFG